MGENRWVSPDEITVADLAMADQGEAVTVSWVENAVSYLEWHVERVHGGDVTRCRSYCGDDVLFTNVHDLTHDELANTVLALLHRLLVARARLRKTGNEERK